MKKMLAMVLATGGFAVASLIVSTLLETRHAAQQAEQQAAWQAEKTALEAALVVAKDCHDVECARTRRGVVGTCETVARCAR